MLKPLVANNSERTRAIRAPYNYRLGQLINDVEITDPISQTVPDQSMSVQELLSRHERGLPVSSRQPVYNDDPDLPDLEKMDFFERQELADQNAEFIKNKRNEMQEADNRKRTKAVPQKTDEEAKKSDKSDEPKKSDNRPQDE